MLESEQAQAVARWSHSGYEEMTRYDDGVYVLYDDHKAIVDSQAQKIEKLLAENNMLSILVDELKADREAQAVRLEKVESLYAIARTQVDEQAKEIERLKQRIQGEYDAKAGF